MREILETRERYSGRIHKRFGELMPRRNGHYCDGCITVAIVVEETAQLAAKVDVARKAFIQIEQGTLSETASRIAATALLTIDTLNDSNVTPLAGETQDSKPE